LRAEILENDDVSHDLIQGTFGLVVPEVGFEPTRRILREILGRKAEATSQRFVELLLFLIARVSDSDRVLQG